MVYIFMIIKYLKKLTFDPPPLNICVSRVVRPHSFNLSLHTLRYVCYLLTIPILHIEP